MAVWGAPLLVVSMAALLWWLWHLLHGDLNRNAQIVGILGIVGIVGTLAQVALAAWSLRLQQRLSAPGSVDEPTRLNRAARTLATAVKAQWGDEAGTQGLRHPRPLQLHWSTTGRPVAAPAEAITGRAVGGRVVRVRLRGSLDEVAEKFLALPHRRLVVLGEPGAGKTVLAVLLTLQLLNRREHDGPQLPVPVLLSLSSWDPTVEHLHTWIGRRLAEDYPALANTAAYGPQAAQELIGSGRLLPVLDGLDEVTASLQGTAVEALDRAHGGPLVVTCRSVEYEQAVAADGALAAAAVVELQPASVEEVISFLRAAAVPHQERWEPVFVHLRAFPEGILARVLASPLMAALARTVYATVGRQPNDLVELAQGNDQASIERGLLEGFVPALYAARPPAPGAPPRRLHRSWSPEQAERWLRLLARHLHRRNTYELAWWQLDQLVPRPVMGLAGGLAVGLAVGLAFGLAVGLAFGLAGGLLVGFGSPSPPPARVDLQIRGRLRALIRSLAVGLTVGPAVGLAGGFLNWAQTPTDSALAADPLSVLRGSRALLIGQLLVSMLTSMLTFALAFAPAGGLAGRLAFGLTVGLPAGLTFALAFALLGGGTWNRYGGAAYGRFSIARTWLALCGGRLPWRLTAFLDDAHRRGVIRQAGAMYQFRHARLQDHLAGD